MASRSAIPTNRNFSGTKPRNSNQRNHNPIQIFIFTLLFLAIGLLCSAIYLSRQLDLKNLALSSNNVQNDGRLGAAAIDTNSAVTTDRKRGMNGDNHKKVQSNAAADTQKIPNNQLLVPHLISTTTTDFSNVKEYPNDRLYCMVPFIWNPQIYTAIMSTWGQRCDTIHFLTDAMVGGQLNGDHISFDDKFSSSSSTADDSSSTGTKPYWEYPPNTFPSNVKFINMTRSWENCDPTTDRQGRIQKKVCRHIWEKMWRSWVYVDEHHKTDAEWFCKVDYDTFFFPDNLKYYVRDVKQWDPLTEHHYFGHVIQHRSRRDRPMVVGASACWSRKTLGEIAQVYRTMPKGSVKGERGKCEDRAHATEEVTTSQCLREHLNIEPEAARDDQLREYITIDKYPLVLTWNRTEQGEWWYWKGKPEGAGQMENTIARRPIGIHKYKKPEEILTLWEEFYGPSGNDALERVERQKHGVGAKKFLLEVRKAMGIDP
eukprot:CAMPEP_0201691180 /NCGR_PEP_ID=MMETSP0578-20130828/4415_1 /ASSEMBLY_ACC=CAM_ASM_000663 /TAXON_ID=267565 /ORGANISM="Skeletonema grethea, Strain CCMP 1804" /LENGTH=484 /DNA_ID=CAMNT_0048176337 /DNA_START=16 /DNA_END=1470 /DNA_ORIENTATION=+